MLRNIGARNAALAAGTVLLLLAAATAARIVVDKSGAVANDEATQAAHADPAWALRSLDRKLVARLRRGHHPVRSEDITLVPREPNFIGSFTLTSHSGPWDYLQNIPLVLYGPHYIAASQRPLVESVNVTDVYPTVAELLDLELDPRDGKVLTAALPGKRPGPPRLVVVVVWDGVGRNTLERWPDSWPNLQRLEREGTSYAGALVGSSPSITSVVHSSLGTGAWPRHHGISGNHLRGRNGRLRGAFAGRTGDDLELSTFADQADLAFGNASKVGLLAWKQWHLAMMGHGRSGSGGDPDEVALIHYDDGIKVTGNNELYSTPSGLRHASNIQDHLGRLDHADGRVDGRWRGHDITVGGEKAAWNTYSNPAWARFQGDLSLAMLERGDYGEDAVPDFFFVNFKMTDLAGHQWGMDSPETADVLRAQDAELGRLLRYLDREVGEYVAIVTSDHGHAPAPTRSGAWPIDQTELIADIDRRFSTPAGSSLVKASAAYGLYLNRPLLEELYVTKRQISAFINAYTVAQNWPQGELPEGYEQRGSERVFSAAFPSALLEEVTPAPRQRAPGG
jgi:hypothetical protein